MSASSLSVTANPRHRILHVTTTPSNPETTLPPTSQPLPKKPTTRTRKPTPTPSSAQKPLLPRWLTKQLLALLILAALVEMLRRMVITTKTTTGPHLVGGLSEMEGRLSVIETSLKTTAKMLQVQVEVVDKKVEGLVGDVRRDAVRRVEESVREFDTRVARLDTAVGEIKEREVSYVTKAEVERMYEELKRGGNDMNYDLDEVRRAAREVVEREMERHVADGLGRVEGGGW